MNLRAANSPGSAAPAPPPPFDSIEVILPDGSCIPATRSTLKKILKQARSAALKARKAKRQEIADELQRNLEDRAAARRLLAELAGYERDHRRMAAVLRVRVKPDQPVREASGIRKRASPVRFTKVVVPPLGSSWVIDDRGMRGVQYHQSYLSRKAPGFYRGAARDRWEYDARDEAVMRDTDGEVILFSNLGDDIDEIGAAWQCIEDATTRINGKVQIRIIVPFDADASAEEQMAALRHFCETVLAPLGLPYSAVAHHSSPDGDQRNQHGHILTSLRPIERRSRYCWAFADEVRGELDGKNGVQMLRHLWAHSMSEAAEASGRNMRYTGLSYAARGLALEAGEHLGEARSAMVARDETVWAHERNRIKAARNVQLLVIRDLDRKMAALTSLRDAVIAERTGPISPPRRMLAATGPLARPLAVLRGTTNREDVPRPLVPASVTRAAITVPEVARTRLTPAVGIGATDRGWQREVAKRTGARNLEWLSPAMVVATPIAALAPAASLAPRLDILSPASRSGPSERPILVTTAPRVGKEAIAALSSAQTERRPAATPSILEKIDHLVRRKAADRPTAAISPGIAALRHRRALAEASERPAAPWRLPERVWLELNPQTQFTRVTRNQALAGDRKWLEWIALGHGYVSRDGNGLLTQASDERRGQAPDDTWWSQAHVQDAMADLRRRQLQQIEHALRAGQIDPAGVGEDGSIPWGAAVDPADRFRLERWSRTPAFHADMAAIARRLAGHADDRTPPVPARMLGATQQPSQIPDGFGGWRDTPAPLFAGTTPPYRIAAFDPKGGKPTKQLLTLLKLAGEHPRRIEFASDGRLMAIGDRPALLAPLLHGWRHDDRVGALVTDTVTRSRAAGRPMWRDDIASAVRSLASQTVSDPAINSLPDADRGPDL